MDIQRLRNLTTGIIHTDISDVYRVFEEVTLEPGIMTHQIPAAYRALKPWLVEKIKDERFFNNKLDVEHVGEFDLPAMTKEEKDEFFKRFKDEMKHTWKVIAGE